MKKTIYPTDYLHLNRVLRFLTEQVLKNLLKFQQIVLVTIGN